jgi:hypothetical protein
MLNNYTNDAYLLHIYTFQSNFVRNPFVLVHIHTIIDTFILHIHIKDTIIDTIIHHILTIHTNIYCIYIYIFDTYTLFSPTWCETPSYYTYNVSQ